MVFFENIFVEKNSQGLLLSGQKVMLNANNKSTPYQRYAIIIVLALGLFLRLYTIEDGPFLD